MTEIPRQIVEAEIEMLIDLLDKLDDNPDLEDCADIENDTADDEPLHGAPEQQAGSWAGINPSDGGDDGEEVELGWTKLDDRFGRYQAAGNDVYEPSLGSNGGINQNNWSKGPSNDLEEQCDDDGAINCDLEPDHDNERWSDGFPNPGTFCSPITTVVG